MSQHQTPQLRDKVLWGMESTETTVIQLFFCVLLQQRNHLQELPEILFCVLVRLISSHVFPKTMKGEGNVSRLTPFWAKVTYWWSTGNTRSWRRSRLRHQLSSCMGRQIREETHHGVYGSAQLCDPRQILIHLSLSFHILKWRWGCAKIDWNNTGGFGGLKCDRGKGLDATSLLYEVPSTSFNWIAHLFRCPLSLEWAS